MTNETTNNNEILKPLTRWAELFPVVAMLLVAGFFYLHEVRDTGFFTEAFGDRERLALYGPIALSLAAPLVRAISGRRNPGRPFEALTGLALALGSLWLFINFPFDFKYLTAILPRGIRFVLIWINNPIGRIILLIQVAAGTISALVNTIQFIRQLFRGPTQPVDSGI